MFEDECSVAVEVVQHKIVQIGPPIQKESDNLYKLGINAAGYIYNKTTIETETIV